MWNVDAIEASSLYRADQERDNCGVALIANLHMHQVQHEVVEHGLEALQRLDHRGACCEQGTGDGVGMLTAIPHDFFQEEVFAKKQLRVDEHSPVGEEEAQRRLSQRGAYGVGLVFFLSSLRREERAEAKKVVAREADRLGLCVAGWREVPLGKAEDVCLGRTARANQPHIEQVFVVTSSSSSSSVTQEEEQNRLERDLYVLRKRASAALNIDQAEQQQQQEEEKEACATAASGERGNHTGPHGPRVYFCSLSSRTLVYKGQLTSTQFKSFYLDLSNPLYRSHFALVHSRFSTNTFPSWDRCQPNRITCHNGEINTLRGNLNWMKAREGQLQEQPPTTAACSSNEGRGERNVAPKEQENGMEMTVVEPHLSDSGVFDCVLELLVLRGSRSLPEAMMMMVPEAWQNQGPEHMDPRKRDFYRFHSCLMEPWDGPAMLAFSDGRYAGAVLDRNGLRPARVVINTKTGRVVMGSEVGLLDVAEEEDGSGVLRRMRLEPGKMFLVDFEQGRIVSDEEFKREIAGAHPYGDWLREHELTMEEIMEEQRVKEVDSGGENQVSLTANNDPRLALFNYTEEDMNIILRPMAEEGVEPLGSMGNDAALACLSSRPRVIYDYFQQLFAQVTNPPIDPIREGIVMSLQCHIGPEGNLLQIYPTQCKRFCLAAPVLTETEMNALKKGVGVVHQRGKMQCKTICTTFQREDGPKGLEAALERICQEAERAVDDGFAFLLLSDRKAATENNRFVPVSSLLACGAVHHHLVQAKKRMKVGLLVESGEAREVHHMCVLLGFGADAICPYMAFACIRYMTLHAPSSSGDEDEEGDRRSVEQRIGNYVKSLHKGILKVMAKMGISTLQSYKGAQIFEAVGLHQQVIRRCFVGVASRIQGLSFDLLAREALQLYDAAWSKDSNNGQQTLENNGIYHWREEGELHAWQPQVIATLQEASRSNSSEAFRRFTDLCDKDAAKCTLRGLLTFAATSTTTKVPLEEVEPASAIVKRFVTGAMSYGSISWEAHTTLARAMNKIGAKSNTGEGGEDPLRYNSNKSSALPDDDHGQYDNLNSAIKQVASARFGVTSGYLASASELQIKMAQGAKPGEGGELPGHKVVGHIASTRHSTPGVGLISPPPHHDIYSIEDLKQLIHDLKNSNPQARISVKLVSKVGVGVIAAGVAKASADHILISGHDGGTGASRWTGIKHAGLPWELGLAETHQTLVLNGLRGRVVLQADGGMRTGRDVVMAALLGAEEVGFGTVPLVVMGCVMMRKCHLNTCPVGVATQDPELRAKFTGQPEHVVNYFFMVAEQVREIMAELGFRSFEEMVGKAPHMLIPSMTNQMKVEEENNKRKKIEEEEWEQSGGISLWSQKAQMLDLRPLLFDAAAARRKTIEEWMRNSKEEQQQKPISHKEKLPEEVQNVEEKIAVYNVEKQDHRLAEALDNELIQQCSGVLDYYEAAQQKNDGNTKNDEQVSDKKNDEATTTMKQRRRLQVSMKIRNTNRTVGTMLSYHISHRFGESGLPDGTLHFRFQGSAGQSFGAFLAKGITMEVEGDCNDYVGKGLSGGRIIVYPSSISQSSSLNENDVVLGNVCLYGATAGEAFIRGAAAERFCVRNSGAKAVVEGVGDHGCEYMTGGRVIVLGKVGRNFAAGMSGGIAYLWNDDLFLNDEETNGEKKGLEEKEGESKKWLEGWKKWINLELVGLEKVTEEADRELVVAMVKEHRRWTGSQRATLFLSDVEGSLRRMVKVMPHDYKRAVLAEKQQAAEERMAENEEEKEDGKSSVSPPMEHKPAPPLVVKDIEDMLASSSFSSSSASSKRAEEKVQEDRVHSKRRQRTSSPNIKKQEKIKGFMLYSRKAEPYRETKHRLNDYDEIYLPHPPASCACSPSSSSPSSSSSSSSSPSTSSCSCSCSCSSSSIIRAREEERTRQAARCMDCGVPFCHQSGTGCPLHNLVPEWNDLVYRGRWKEALDRLLSTNNFPEFTGRVCPAPCEGACTLGINEQPVTIKNIERAIIDHAWRNGWMDDASSSCCSSSSSSCDCKNNAKNRIRRKVAIVGSGPAGLAAADELNKAGCDVTVFERADRVGGLLMYGIPEMKLEKSVVERRVDLMTRQGVRFVTNALVVGEKEEAMEKQKEKQDGEGKQHQTVVSVQTLKEDYDALLLACGSTTPRDLPIAGRHELDGIHFALDFLENNTRFVLQQKEERKKKMRNDKEKANDDPFVMVPPSGLTAKDKDVIVIGGGDTGNDCIATSIRQGCRSLVNFELLPQPPKERAEDNPWPAWPKILRQDYGHEEAALRFDGEDPRRYCILSKEFLSSDEGDGKEAAAAGDEGSNGRKRVKGIRTVRVKWTKREGGRWGMEEVAGSERIYPCDLVLLAMGYTGPERGIADGLALEMDARMGTFRAEFGRFRTSRKGVFAAGDCRRGQSLVVWAIREGREAAACIVEYLHRVSEETEDGHESTSC